MTRTSEHSLELASQWDATAKFHEAHNDTEYANYCRRQAAQWRVDAAYKALLENEVQI